MVSTHCFSVCVLGPHPEWDPEIVAALDGDFDDKDPENVLEDDFFVTVS